MKKMLLTVWYALFFIVGANAQNFIGNESDIAEIKKNIDQFSKYVMASNYDGIANAYTEDGKIMPNGTPIISGREDIKQRWTLPEGVEISYHKILPEEIKVVNDHAYDYGYYEGTSTRKDGTEISWKGKYVIVWKQVDGTWKIYLDIWNRVE